MRLYKGQVTAVARDLAKKLIEEGDLEVQPNNVEEVEKDIESVLKEYIRLDRELSSEARDVQSRKGGNFGRIKAKLAERKGVELHDDPIGYIINQLIDIFFHSHFVDEVFVPDRTLRLHMKPILEDYMTVEEELDEEVRDKIKNLEEGSREWDVEYKKVMERIKRKKNLD
ncbi:MAG: DUF507 family protein [Persicimonas sp.]